MTNLVLPDTNLYLNGQVSVFSDGAEILERDLVKYGASLADRYHIVKYEDTLDKLANFYYKAQINDASKLWWVIADVNFVQNPLDISGYVGQTILIPNIFKFRLKL